MKRKDMMLSMIILGPRQPRNDIDVYLSSLIEDLRLWWDEGICKGQFQFTSIVILYN